MATGVTTPRLPSDGFRTLVAVGACLLALGWVFLRTDRLASENFRQPQAHAGNQAKAMVEEHPASATVPPQTPGIPLRSPITPIEVTQIPPSAEPDALSLGTPAPAPVVTSAPRLPFALIGRVHDDRGWTVLLVKNGTKYVAREGNVLEGVWHIEAIDEEGITFRHTPTGTQERLALTAQGNDVAATQLAPIARSEAAGSGRVAIRQSATISAAPTQTSSDETATAVAPPPVFQRRLVSADIPREPWVCEASRANALLPCRNTWSMSEAQRVACRQAADRSYNSCLGSAMAAPAEEEE